MTRRAAVLGSPIAHSLSPVLHRAAYASLGLPWTYDAIDVTEAGLVGFIDACGPEWVGLSLTMPLKTAVLPLLADVSDLAAITGAANTVLFTEAGRLGHNTDVPGMVRAISDLSPSTRSGLVLGGGATARSAVAALAALGVEHVTVAIRDPRRAHEIDPVVESLHLPWSAIGWDEARHHLGADVVISTVPRGSADHLVADLPDHPGVLLDVAYGDGATPLDVGWRRLGGRSADGIDLLLWQAADQVRLMTGLEPPVEAMRTAVRAAHEG